MACWITIYLQDSLPSIDMNEIKHGVSPADWWSLGEEFGIEENDVSNFMKSLQWRNDSLQVGQEGTRPIQIHIYNNSERIKEEIEEISHKNIPLLVKKHLESIKTIVALELGISQLKTMYEVVAFEIAYWLAETKRGLICSPDDYWYDHDKHRWNYIK